jgi:hypothetical protein
MLMVRRWDLWEVKIGLDEVIRMEPVMFQDEEQRPE